MNKKQLLKNDCDYHINIKKQVKDYPCFSHNLTKIISGGVEDTGFHCLTKN